MAPSSRLNVTVLIKLSSRGKTNTGRCLQKWEPKYPGGKSGKSEWVRVGVGGERVWLGVWLFTCGDILGLCHRENKFEHMDNQF